MLTTPSTTQNLKQIIEMERDRRNSFLPAETSILSVYKDTNFQQNVRSEISQFFKTLLHAFLFNLPRRYTGHFNLQRSKQFKIKSCETLERADKVWDVYTPVNAASCPSILEACGEGSHSVKETSLYLIPRNAKKIEDVH